MPAAKIPYVRMRHAVGGNKWQITVGMSRGDSMCADAVVVCGADTEAAN